MMEQERQYKRHFQKFAKDVVNGNHGKELLEPTYYKDKYSEDVQTDLSELDWFPKVQPPNVPYDLTPYTGEVVKEKVNTENPLILG